MKKIIIVFAVILCFSMEAFAASSDYTEDSSGKAENPKEKKQDKDHGIFHSIFKGSWILADLSGVYGFNNNAFPSSYKDMYFAPGITLGGSILKHLAIQASIFYSPSQRNKKSNDIYTNAMLVFQKKIDSSGLGFRPYIAAGVAMENIFNVASYPIFGLGVATEVGVRFYFKHLLVGIHGDYDIYFPQKYHAYFSGMGHNSIIRAGVSIGYVF